MMTQETPTRSNQPAPGPHYESPPPQPGYWPGAPYPPNSYPPMMPPPPKRRSFLLVTALLVVSMLFFVAMVLLALLLAFSGGNFAVGGPTQTLTQTVPAGTATSATVTLDAGIADLTVTGGATNLMDATFQYNNDRLRPIVDYSTSGTAGSLSVRQPDIHPVFSTHNDWQVRLTDALPLDLRLQLGVGNSIARLAGLKVTHLTVASGVGNSQIDLTGVQPQTLDVAIQGGVGNCHVVLPKDIGVRLVIDRGLGDVTVHNVYGSGNTYTNAAYGKTSATITVNVKVGVGNLTVD